MLPLPYTQNLCFLLHCTLYFFQLEDSSGQVLYYGEQGFYEQCIQDVGQMFDCPQTLREEERFLLPGWAKNKVVYQIFPSRFATDKELPETVKCEKAGGSVVEHTV